LKRTVSGIMLILLLMGMLIVMLNIQPVKAVGTIYIRADGSIDPPTAPIQRNGDYYTFTANIYDSIVIQRSYIVVDGNTFTLQGSGSGLGFSLVGINDTTIANTNIRNFDYGVRLETSYNNEITQNNMTTNTRAGILLYSSSFNYVCRNNITNSGPGPGVLSFGIYIFSSNNNTIFKNYVANNNAYGIGDYGNNNIICENNIIANKGFGIRVSASGSRIYHNNFIDNGGQVLCYGNAIWDDGYPSGGNYWSDYNGTDLYRGPNQNEPGSDNIGDAPYVINENNRDRYPFINPYGTPPPPTYSLTITVTVGGITNPSPGVYAYTAGSNVFVTAIPDIGYMLDHWELDGNNIGAINPTSVTMDADHTLQAVFVISLIHDIAVTDVAPSKTVVGQGYSLNINVTAANQSDCTETFNVTVYANTTEIETREIILSSGTSTIITFTWNTTGFAKGNYTIKAYAWPVQGETDTEDNTKYFDGIVKVTIPSDINGDKTVNILDCILLANHFGHTNGNGHTPGTKEWRDCMNCDINNDGTINILDCIILAGHFGQSWS